MTRRYGIKYDVDVLYPLNKLGKVLAILPWYGKDYEHPGKRGVIYGIFVVCIFLAVSAVSMYATIAIAAGELAPTVAVTNLGCNLFLTLVAIGSIIGVNFAHGECVCKFLKELQGIDQQLIEYRRESKYPRCRLCCEIIFGHLLFLFYYIYNVAVWIVIYGTETMKYFVCRDIQYYHTIILLLLLRTYAKVIRCRLEILNEALIQIGYSAGVNYSASDRVFRTVKDEIKEVRKLMKVFTHLSDSVKKYNEVFGWQYMTVYIWIGLNILNAIDAFLVYGAGDKSVHEFTFGAGFVILCVVWVLVPIIALVGLSSTCDKGTKAAVNTGDICYNLINAIPKIDKNITLLDELRNFSAQATARCPQFSAGGFYTINYGAIFTIGGVITSYLVVLIQFHK